MSQYNAGRVLLQEGSAMVAALWELILPTAASPYHSNARLQFSPSGAIGRCISHDAGRNMLVADTAGVQASDSISGPVRQTVLTFVSGSGHTSTVIQVPSGLFAPGQHFGRWLRVTIAGIEQWRRVTANTASSITVTPGYTAPPANGSAMSLHDDQTLVPVAFRRGTPQNFQLGGVANGQIFYAEGNAAGFEIANVTPTGIILSANYADPRLPVGSGELIDLPFAVHKSETPNRDYPYYETGDVQTASVFRSFALAVDDEIQQLFDMGVGGGPPVEAFGVPNLGPGVSFFSTHERPLYYKDRQRVHVQGTVYKGSAWVHDAVILQALPSGYWAAGKLQFAQQSGRWVEAWADGTIRYGGPDDGYVGAIAVNLSFRIGGTVQP